MNEFYEKLHRMNPAYLSQFEDFIKSHCQFGGGAEKEKYTQARSFSNVYEFYIYAFFIGLYKNKKLEIIDGDQTKTFWEIGNWKPRELVDYLITCAIAESDFDMASYELMKDEDASSHLKLIKNQIEAYANGGLKYLFDTMNDDPELSQDDMFFIRLLA